MNNNLLFVTLALLIPCCAMAHNSEECRRKNETPGWQIINDSSHSDDWHVLRRKYPLVTSQLILAAIHGDDDSIQNLMASKPSKNDMANALYVASSMGRLSTIKALVKSGASPNLEIETGFTALYAASQYGCSKTISLLVRLGANVNLHTHARYSVLMSAIDNEQYLAAEVLIDHGYHASDEEKSGIRRVLHHYGHDAIYRRLFGDKSLR